MLFPEKESSTVEWKEEVPKNNQIVKTIIGFANQFGGRLIIGVADSGTVVGIQESQVDELDESIMKLIYDNSFPPILPSIYSLRFDEKLVLVIEVSQGMNKPYFVKNEGLSEGTYIRLGAMTIKATSEIIQELQHQSRGIHYDSLPVYNASKDDLNLVAIESFLKTRKGGAHIVNVTDPLLRSYHLITEEHSRIYPTVAGILLFGKQPGFYLPQSFIICTCFSGHVGRDGILASKDCQGTLFEQFEAAYAWLWDILNKSSMIKGLKRKDLLEIPEEAIREALLNSLLHRNWRIQGPNRISVYPTRIEFFSPGVFPGPLQIGQLELGMTHSRNHTITKVFRETGYIESLGSGFPTIFKTFRSAGLEKPQVTEGVEFVKCILPRKKKHITGNRIDDLIFDLFAGKDIITSKEVARAANISAATATRTLNHLIDGGKLQRHGQGPTTHYTLVEKEGNNKK